MALWQTDFFVVPKRALAAAPAPLTADALDAASWWAGAALPADYRERLDAAAPRVASSSPEIEAWGADDGNRVEVWREQGRVARVRARVDVRRLDAKFAAGLLTFVRAADAVLVRADGRVTEPTAGGFGLALRGSAAWRFVQDPRGALDRLRAEPLDDD
ncbi:MAG TPA: hypothetical protein VFJ74_09340 [Gemmatimonadaceae bacterium]|nr:hypothetical protein [Gemmatimonadaceae bacterium]